MGRIATGWLMLVALVGCGGDQQQQSSQADPISGSGVFTYTAVEALKEDDRSDPENARSGVEGLIENIESMADDDMGKDADKYKKILQGAKELDQLYGRLVAGEKVAPSEFDQTIDEMMAVARTLPGAVEPADESKEHGHKHD